MENHSVDLFFLNVDAGDASEAGRDGVGGTADAAAQRTGRAVDVPPLLFAQRPAQFAAARKTSGTSRAPKRSVSHPNFTKKRTVDDEIHPNQP